MKKLTAILLTLAMLLSLTATAITADEPAQPDNSRPVEIKDVVYILMHCAKMHTLPAAVYDFNDDGVLDIKDAVIGLMGLAKMIEKPMIDDEVIEVEKWKLKIRRDIAEIFEYPSYSFVFGNIYNGGIIFVVYVHDGGVVGTNVVAGYTFRYPMIFFWYNNGLYGLIQAYAQGLLTIQDIDELYNWHFEVMRYRG